MTHSEVLQNHAPERVTYGTADARSLAWLGENTEPMEIASYEVEFRKVALDVDGKVSSKGRLHRTFIAASADDHVAGHGHGSQVRLYIDRDFICILNAVGDFADKDEAERWVGEIFDEFTAPEVMRKLESLPDAADE